MTRRRALVLLWTLPAAILVATSALTYHAFRIAPPDRLDGPARAAAIAPLRAVLDGSGAPAPATASDAPIVLVATIWSHGRAVARVDGRGDDLAAAASYAASALAADHAVRGMAPAERADARVQLDVVAGRAPLGGDSPLLDNLALPGIADMLAIQSGVDGVGTTIAGRDVLMLPHELVAQKLVSSKQPSNAMPELAMGLDLPKLEQLLAQRAGVPRGQVPGLFRFRTDAFVEPPRASRAADTTPIPLTRGIPPRPELSAAALRAAALAGGRYLVGHLAPNGRFVYEVDLATGRQSDPKLLGGNYSLPRHAGTTYFLSELYRITGEAWLREPIERALAHMISLVDQFPCHGAPPDDFDCVLDKGERQAQLGSTALGVVALAEYQRATGDTRYAERARRLAAFLLYMQRPDGSFRHLYDPATHAPDDDAQLLYYTGESTLALARMYTVTHDERYAAAAQRGLDWSVDWYEFFLGGFFYGEEHWTCITAEALWPYAQADRYREFCDGYGAFLRDQQTAVGDLPDADDLAGAYDVTAFVPPYNTPAGSRTEAMVSAYKLDLDHGAPDPAILGQIRAALGYALGQQLRPDGDFDSVGDVDGGMPGSPVDRTVRIDYVQHVCSAMIRASEILGD
jgi:hypothetical protein|nr:hypothetical protein [Kofleriaceae bacterium]